MRTLEGRLTLMPYARLDDRYDDHRKIKRAWRQEPAAVALHAMAITYANRHTTDGLIDEEWISEKLSLLPYREKRQRKVIEVLLACGLFARTEHGEYIVHDFLEWNLSREKRQELSRNGRKGGSSKGDRPSPPNSPGLSQGLSEGLSQGLSEGFNPPTPTPTPTPKRRENSTAELRSAVAECFAYWQERCHHPQATLTSDREGKLKARLRERARLGGGITRAIYDVRKAIDGAAHGAFVNEQGKRFDDLELICRSGSKLEDFMERAEPRVQAVPGRSYQRPNASEMLRAINGGAA